MNTLAEHQHVTDITRKIDRARNIPVELSPRILESWQRSRDIYQIDPGTKLKVPVLTRTEWRERHDKLEQFLFVANSYIASLHGKLAGLNFCVLITDDRGATVDLRNGGIQGNDLKRLDLVRGSCWPENAVGTGGIGTALHERVPILIHRNEHYHTRLFEMSCSTAPVFDINDEIIAVLNTTGLNISGNRASQSLIYGLVVQTAAMIENAWFLAQNQHRWVVELSDTPGFFTAATDQIIAFDESGQIFAGNKAARDALLSDVRGQMVGLDSLFDIQPYDLIHSARKQPGCVQEICSYRNGVRRQFYARVRGPSHRSQTAPTPSRSHCPEVGQDTVGLSGMNSSDPQMTANIAMVRRLIDKRLPILLLGETGTGKEVFARAVHEQSARHDKPFVAVNCAAIPETLIESELFGYRPGAFTGAKAKGERGKILQADGGTLFLDEIGDMPLSLQTRLLRVLAEGEVAPLGSPEIDKVDLNIICATHRNLPEMVRQGLFREDLYYRLNAATVRLPALRERSDLQKLLLQVFAEEAAAAGREELRLSAQVQSFASTYPWPGNIRQLRNVVRFAIAVCEGGEVDITHLPPDVTRQPLKAAWRPSFATENASVVLQDPGASCERDRMISELRHHQWQVSATASAMGIARATFYRRMKRYGIVTPNRAEANPPNA